MLHPQNPRMDYAPGRIRMYNNVGTSNFPHSRNANPPNYGNPVPRNKVVYSAPYLRPQMPPNCGAQQQQQQQQQQAPPPPPAKYYPFLPPHQAHRRTPQDVQSIEKTKKQNFVTMAEVSHDPAMKGYREPVESGGNNRGESNGVLTEVLGNDKLKTPMCLVNELARYNKLTHQYRLTNESGPAHKKKFTVMLRLGTEEYSAEGQSIKKAQHLAAADAMAKTKYSHPPPKPSKTTSLRANSKKNAGNITPTVELNAFAMKQGLAVSYTLIEDDACPGGAIVDGQAVESGDGGEGDFYETSQNLKKTRFNEVSAKTPDVRVSLKVGFRTFIGIGVTLQAARHNAASRALEVLRSIKSTTCDEETTTDGSTSANPAILNDLKSPISLVHEIALKRQLGVTFEVKQEKGPPHMKIFVTICKVGEIVTEGEGNGKKMSRKKAAEKMLDELKSLGPIPTTNTESSQLKMKKKVPTVKKKNRNLIKENVAETTLKDLNPISHLIQLSQARKEKEPVYTLVEEKGAPRRREFVLEVELNGVAATGSGPNKKNAKRNAAMNLLVKMGRVSTTSEKSQDAEKDSSSDQTQKSQTPPPAGAKEQVTHVNNKKNASSDATDSNPTEKVEKPTTATPAESQSTSNVTSSAVKPKQQLLYLAQLLDFQVNFSDFPKGNHGEFLTLVTLSTFPPQLCHGAGNTMEESNDQAALKALSLLRELGLDNIKKQPESS